MIIQAKAKSLTTWMLLSLTRKCHPLLAVLAGLNVLKGAMNSTTLS
jgi:hypothetical protein